MKTATRTSLHSRLIISASIWVVAAAWTTGCSSMQNMASSSSVDPGANACPAGIGGEPRACCDSNGTPLTTPPTGITCPEAIPGAAPILYHVGQGAASAGGSAGESVAAQSLVGGQKANTTQYSGATAGSVPVSNAQQGTVPRPSSMGNSPVSSQAGGNSRVGGSSSSGGLSVMGALTTAPAPSPSSSNGVTGDDLAAAAYGGGGGAILPNGAKETGFHFGNGLTGGASFDSTAGAEIKFAEGTSAMSSEDPSDYFTRIGIEDSIFKKVEKRYRSTSANWTAASLSSPLSSLPSAPKTRVSAH